MRRRSTTGLAVGAGIVLFVSWLFLAPTQLGGPVVYSTIDGISMQPLLHRGELVLVRPRSEYRVADVVLYASPTLHRSVLHRLVAIQHGRYFFKGDNNDFVDPGWVRRSDLLGSLWMTVPYGGSAIDWLRTPAHTALVVAAVVLLLLGTGIVARGPRRATADMRRAIGSGRGWRPRRTPLSVVAALAVALGLVLTVLGFANPTQRVAQRSGAYVNTGSFSYSARTHPDAVYPSGLASTGQPLFLDRFRSVTMRFRYQLTAQRARDVRGTISLRALLWANSDWHSFATLARTTRFTGTATSVSGTVDLVALQDLLVQLGRDSGVVGGSYNIELQPTVHVTGVVAGHRISDTFSPTLPLTASTSTLGVDLAAVTPPALPGATFQTSSPQATLDAALHPTSVGSVPTRVPGLVTIARYRVRVDVLRVVGPLLVLAGLAAVLGDQLRRRRHVWAHDRRIAHRHEIPLIDVSGLAPGALDTATVVTSLEGLAAIARLREQPVLRLDRDQGPVYAVEDSGRTYVCPTEPARATVVTLEQPPPARAPLPPRRARLLRLLGIGIAVPVLLVTSVALTAGNTVPPSYAGALSQPRQIAQLMPSQCAGMNLTNLVIGATGTVTGTSGNDLILDGRHAGMTTYSGLGGNDCIVAGGDSNTRNTIDGGAGTDVCIGGANAKSNSFTNCEKTY